MPQDFVNMTDYTHADPTPNKFLNPDGSVSTMQGQLISPPTALGAQRYVQSNPIPNKLLNRDGTLGTLADSVRLSKLEEQVDEMRAALLRKPKPKAKPKVKPRKRG